MSFSRDDHGSNPLKAETLLVTAGRDTKAQKGFVNPPVVRGSTVLYPRRKICMPIAASSSMAAAEPRPPRRCRKR
jgi:hypothetical protein